MSIAESETSKELPKFLLQQKPLTDSPTRDLGLYGDFERIQSKTETHNPPLVHGEREKESRRRIEEKKRSQNPLLCITFRPIFFLHIKMIIMR